MFKTEAPSEQQRTGHSRRGSSLFNFGFNTSQSQPKRKSASIVEPTETIDEFAGLSFTALLEAYLEEPTGTPSTPAEAIMRTPEGRLSDAVTTATELLDRVYSAYRRRTESLQDTFAELELQKELLATEKNRSATFQLSLDRISQDAELKATESAGQISAQQTRIAELEAELAAERSRREKAEEQLQIRAIMNDRSKRASAASGSDSGFESDADSLASRRQQRHLASGFVIIICFGVHD